MGCDPWVLAERQRKADEKAAEEKAKEVKVEPKVEPKKVEKVDALRRKR